MPPLLGLIVHPRDLVAERARAAVVRAVASSALDMVQLRTGAAADEQEEKEEDADADAVAAARELRLLLDRHRGPRGRPALVVNAPLSRALRLRLAASVRIDGWHLKERELLSLARASAAAQRQLAWLRELRAARSPFWVGASVHSEASALAAARLGLADYLQVGTMFRTASHPDKLEVEGPRLLAGIRAALAAADAGADAGADGMRTRKGPVLVAVGGLADGDHVRQVMAAGADGIAVIRAVLSADDPRDAAARLRIAMEAAAVP